MSDIDNMLVADWARYFHDIRRVKQRILYRKFGVKWANLTEVKKQELCDEVAAGIENILKGKPPAHRFMMDEHFIRFCSKTKDLMRYGIDYDATQRPQTNMRLLSIPFSP